MCIGASRREGLQIGVFAAWFGCPLDGFTGTLRGDPDRRPWLLIGARPGVHVFEIVVLAFEGERPDFSPRAYDQVVRLVEAVM